MKSLTTLKGMMEFWKEKDDGILEGEVTPKSCTSVTVTVDKIVVVLGEKSAAALGEKSAAGMVTVKITEEVITINCICISF